MVEASSRRGIACAVAIACFLILGAWASHDFLKPEREIRKLRGEVSKIYVGQNWEAAARRFPTDQYDIFTYGAGAGITLHEILHKPRRHSLTRRAYVKTMLQFRPGWTRSVPPQVFVDSSNTVVRVLPHL